MSKKQRVVVITGGGSGIGKAVAQKFAANGDKVYILGRRKQTLDEATKETTGDITGLVCDVTDVRDVKTVTDQLVKSHKHVDVLVNCAGGNVRLDEDMQLDSALAAWQAVINLNLTGTFLMIQALRKYLTSPGGRVINVSSLAAFSGGSRPGGESYAAAKAGLHGLSRSFVKIFAPKGITINCIAPGVIDGTEFFAGGPVPDARKAEYIDGIPAGRLGTTEDIAAGAFYLASEEAAFISGDILNINGGAQFSR